MCHTESNKATARMDGAAISALSLFIQALSGDDSLSTFAWEEVSSGLAGVWARSNTREAIWDAMKR